MIKLGFHIIRLITKVTTMYRIGKRGIRAISIAASFLFIANDHAIAETGLIYADPNTISIATGQSAPINLAPSVASVVTAGEIDTLPAVDLGDVLGSVPGVHVSLDSGTFMLVYEISGIRTQFNPTLLFMIDGIPSAPTSLGSRVAYLTDLNIHDIERVEVVRGPGSALHGADAYSGVLNIVTKGKDTSDYVGARRGEYEGEGEVWAKKTFSSEVGQFTVAVNGGKRQGEERYIAADGQTVLDHVFGTQASYAPRYVDTSYTFGRLNLRYQNHGWDAAVRLFDWDRKIGMSFNEVLFADDESIRARSAESYLAFRSSGEKWNYGGFLTVSYMETWPSRDHIVYPPGTMGIFSQGIQYYVATKEYYNQLEFNALYKGVNDHQFLTGMGSSVQGVDDIDIKRNFDISSSGVLIPLHGTIDVSQQAVPVVDNARRDSYLYIQDIWTLAPDWEGTFGARYDSYSDSGSVISPRAALVWAADYDKNIKLLYGRAFRPPTFMELYWPSAGIFVVGNPDLKSQTIDMYQVAIDYRPTTHTKTGINVFYYEADNIIEQTTVATTLSFVNQGNQTGRGLQVEGQLIADNLSLVGHYTYVRSENENGNRTGYSPAHVVYVRGTWLLALWSATIEAQFIGDRARPKEDRRDKADDFIYTNTRISRIFGLHQSGSLGFMIRNFFDVDAREPSRTPGLNIPEDLPLEGRNVYLDVRYSFR